MRILTAALAVPLLTCAPVQAQTGIPAPTPQPTPVPDFPLEWVDRIVEIATDGVEKVGITAFVPAIVSVIALLLVLIAGYWLIRNVWKPQNDRWREERNDRKEEREERLAVQRDLTSYRERQADAEDRRLAAQERQAEADEKLAQRVISMETKQEADAGRTAAVSSINTHTDEGFRIQLEDIRLLIHEAVRELRSVRNEQPVNEERDTTDRIVAKATSTLMEAEKQVKKLHDTGPLGQPSAPTNDKHKPED